MTTDELLCDLTVREMTWMVAMDLLGRMSVRGMVEVMSLVMPDVKG